MVATVSASVLAIFPTFRDARLQTLVIHHIALYRIAQSKDDMLPFRLGFIRILVSLCQLYSPA